MGMIMSIPFVQLGHHHLAGRPHVAVTVGQRWCHHPINCCPFCGGGPGRHEGRRTELTSAPKPSATYETGHGEDDQSRQPTHQRAVDTNELQIRADLGLNAFRRVISIPTFNRGADE